MTVPNTPPDPTRDDVPAVPDTNPFAPPQTQDAAGLPPLPEGIGDGSEAEGSPVERLMSELRIGAATVVVCAVLGLAMAGLWAWLAPKVPLVVDGDRILYADPEGEQRAGADAVFVLVGLGMGILTALGAFLVTRRRGGGISVAVGLAVGGLLGSLGAWRLGRSFGPSHDLIGEARRVGNGGRFYADIDLGAHGALLAWPMAAMVLLLLLSAAFGKREEDPPPYWAGPYGAAAPQAPADGLAGEDGHGGQDVKDGLAGEQGGADGRRPGLG
ncbi:hypothetical protein AB0C76_11445 [Kitasatospora sp. NPDC048722]|uniref:hypothetical protein n=1 Tax=Kitasatospora sp. NPDC048722 TaxID=3155639 RepID=UPI0033E3E62A